MRGWGLSRYDEEVSERVGRRDFWIQGLRSIAEGATRSLWAYWEGQREANPPPPPVVRSRIRPPGAVAESEFRSRCTSCGDCGRACAFGTLAPDDAGRPWLWDPAGHPCYMCDGYPCIAACGTGALTFRDRSLQVIGLATLVPDLCIAHQGAECTACRDACRQDQAIALLEGLPVVDANRCTGCAICVGKCPAPGAIAISPRRT